MKESHNTTQRAGAGVPRIINVWFDQVEDVFTSAGFDSSDPTIVKCP